MTLNIRDRVYLQVFLNGIEFPLDKLNMVQYLHIVESVRCYLPILNLRLVDATKFIVQNNCLPDGAIIKIVLGFNDQKKTYEFRRFNHKMVPSGDGGSEYQISAYLNAPLYWMASTARSIAGTASAAVQQIANTCGLSYEGINTSEAQLWLPGNTRYCEFVRQIAEHAWIDPDSCVQAVVTLDKKLRLINVSDFDKRKATESFSNKGNYSSSYPVTDEKLLSKAGFFNSVGGYQDTRIVQSMVTVEDKDLSEVNVRRNSKSLSMNKALKGSIEQSKVSYAPIDVGNTGDHYEQAQYQNTRLSNLFTFGVDFNTAYLVNSNVLDIVLCELTLPGISGMQEISGNFLLTSKIVYLEGMNLYQKLEVYRHGSNTTINNQEV